MVSSHEDVLSQARERIARYRQHAIGEQNTKSILIEPVLRALGSYRLGRARATRG